MINTQNRLDSSKHSSHSTQFSPQKQQWALINKYKALEFERLKQRQKMVALQKKMSFKRQLDNQLNSKNNVQQQQVQADRRYYQFITHKANQQKQKQQRQKIQKFIKRKQVEQQNAKNLQATRNSRMKDYDTGYHLDIGHKSEQQRRRNSQLIKRNVLDTLDQQLKQKYQQKQRNKYSEMETDYKNLQYQFQYFDNRNSNHKNHGQNPRVYQYYQELQRQRRMKDADLEQRFIQEAAQKKKMMEDQRIRNQQLKKTMIKQQVKQTLDQQVRAHNMKKFQESKINPEEYSYGIIENVFREKKAAYDKNKYIEELRAQAEQQKRKKKMENYMSEEQYRFNLNQLNKIVSGQYAHGNYLDRSLGTIGDNKLLRLGDIKDSIQDRDAQVVKYRLDSLRQKNKSLVLNRSDRSF